MAVYDTRENSSPKFLRNLQRYQVSHSYRYALYAASGQIIVSLFLYLMLRPLHDTPALHFWFGLMVLQQLVWVVVALGRRRFVGHARYTPHWLLHHGGATYLSALLWGLGPGLWFYVADNLLYQGIIILSLLAVASSSIVLHALSLRRGTLFILIILLPLSYSSIDGQTPVASYISLLILVYCALLITLLYQRHRELLNFLATEVEYKQLLHDDVANHFYIKQALQIAKLAHWELNLVSGKLSFSPEAHTMFSLPNGQAVSKELLLNAVHPEDRIPYIRALQNSIAEFTPLLRTFRIIRPDGALHTIRESAEFSFDEDGRAEKMFGVMFDETDLVTAEHKTNTLYQELTRILNNMQDTYYRTEPAGRLTQVSNSIFKLLGYTPTECIGQHISSLFPDSQDGERFIEAIYSAEGSLSNYEALMQHHNGERVWVSMNGQFIRDNHGKTLGIEGTIRDISELKHARKALYQEKEQALVTLESIGDGVITTDKQGQVRYMNPTAERLVGHTIDEVHGTDYRTVFQLIDEESGRSLPNLVKLCLQQHSGESGSNEGILLKSDGSRYHLKITTAPMRDEGKKTIGVVLVLHDISEVMGMAKKLSYQARHDQLTGLYNRSVFEQRTHELIKSAQQEGEQHVLLYMDLDQFKVVNDTCGHNAGDELLKQLAALMHERVRDSDILARLGGDEFGVLLEHCPIEIAEEIANKILVTVREFRFAWQDKAFEVGISIGLVPIHNESGDFTQILSAADAACYVAKDSGRNRIHIYQPDDDAVVQRHGEMQWVHRLSSAFDSDQFQLYAQPIVHVSGERLVSHYEILVRMEDGRGGVIPPNAFIPAAERYNLMPTIDRWVIRHTLEMIREAQGELAFPPVEVAINLSGQSLCDDELLAYVVDLFDETGIPCESVSFEVTETAAVANLTRAKRFISVLRGMGCSFSLDDFGAGLSSFSYLKSLPVDYLKIDGAFVRDMVLDRVSNAMVRSINEIGHLMGLKTIGEYAEDEVILLALRQAGVDYAQGNAVSAPRLFSEILEEEARALRGTTTTTTTPSR